MSSTERTAHVMVGLVGIVLLFTFFGYALAYVVGTIAKPKLVLLPLLGVLVSAVLYVIIALGALLRYIAEQINSISDSARNIRKNIENTRAELNEVKENVEDCDETEACCGKSWN